MSHRILVLGKRGGVLQWYEHLISAGQAMPEVEVEGFALNHNNFRERTAKKISRILDKSKPDKIAASNLQKKIDGFQPTIVLIVDLFYLSESILEVLRGSKAFTRSKIYHWVGDFFDERLVNSKDIIDQYYFSDTGLVSSATAMGLENSEYLPLAFNPALFNNIEPTELRSDALLFVGAWSENRENLLKGIKFPMRIIGKGWGSMTGTPHIITGENISITEVAKLYKKHKFVLNNINSDNINCGLNMRCFEAPASGALLITDDVPDLKLCYEPGNEVVFYRNAQQLTEQYTALCVGNQERQTIQKAGTERAFGHHTYSHRLETIIMNTDEKNANE